MTDFDAALERLISEPSFREALAADPQRALAGYRLSPDEWDVLTSQVDTGSGGQRHVEQRTSKASLFGLMSPLGGMGFLSDDAAPGLGGAGHSGASFGADAHSGASFGADAHSGASFADGQSGASVEPQPDQSGASFGGDEYRPRHGAQGLGAAMGRAGEYMSDGGSGSGDPAPVYDNSGQLYHTRVDADGDGHWDQFTTVDRGDRGVDLAVDRNHDGRVDWVGHDLDRDGLIDEASVDHDYDGVLETRWVDRNGDGWLDVRRPWENGEGPVQGAPVHGTGATDGTSVPPADPAGPATSAGPAAPADPAGPPSYDAQRGYIRQPGDPR